jgi:tetratricopeptide (TPR) repeat protein
MPIRSASPSAWKAAGAAGALWLCFASLAAAQLDRAQELYQGTEYREALRLLEPVREKSGAVHDLIGKCYYRLDEFSKATDAFEKAVGAEPRNTNYWNWLGKAYGRRAETSRFPLSRLGHARRAREHFEKAVALDPQNREALSDLFEYYLEAPGFLGGGLSKAAGLSERLRETDPARYHAMQARLAEKRKEFARAEQLWRRAVELAPAEPGRLADLARFLARQQRFPESDAAFEQAAKLAPDKADLKFTRARTYLDSKRSHDVARRLLEEYLKSSLTPDDPPRAEAERLLRSIGRAG